MTTKRDLLTGNTGHSLPLRHALYMLDKSLEQGRIAFAAAAVSERRMAEQIAVIEHLCGGDEELFLDSVCAGLKIGGEPFTPADGKQAIKRARKMLANAKKDETR